MKYNFYEPLFLSELEYQYPKLLTLLNKQKTFIVKGSESSGKLTTVIKHIEYLKLNYKVIDHDISYDYFKDNYTLRSINVLSFLQDKKINKTDIIILKNYEKFNDKIKELIIKNQNNNFYILITNYYLNHKFNIIYINNSTYSYLSDIYLNIFFLELQKKNIKNFKNIYKNLEIPQMINFYQLQTYLNYNINHFNNDNDNDNDNNLLKIEYDNFKEIDINDIIQEKNFNTKVLSVAKLKSVALINNNLVYNINNIDDLANAYEYILESFNYYNFTISHYYELFNSLNIIAPLIYIDKSIQFKIHQTNFNYVKKINKINKINYFY